MKLNPSLLASAQEAFDAAPTFASCWNARGLYDPLRFVLRLRPDIHRELDSFEGVGAVTASLTFSQAQAFSTFFHETIHWWQHVGSTYGLLSSLLYPAQSHLNHKYLLRIISELGPQKSIKKLNESRMGSKGHIDEAINIAINNWHDLEFFRRVTVDPQGMSTYVENPYFESVGHSYKITASAVLWLLSSTMDPKLEFLPDPRDWDSHFRTLRDKKEPGFYYRSPVMVPPIGAREIFEGQARFSQIQYLHTASSGSLAWRDFDDLGMLGGVYRTAFDFYLKKTGTDWPDSPNSSVVALFLLFCDLAINPGEGFPIGIVHFPSFIHSLDPGLRFLALCLIVREKHPKLTTAIQRYSREEYFQITNLLSKEAVDVSPAQIGRTIEFWVEKSAECKRILQEDRTFEFSPGNLPIRVFFARFLRFQLQKMQTPEFFCWPGWWAAGAHGRVGEFASVFEENGALFVDKADGDVYPRVFPGRTEAALQGTFDDFHAWSASYELVRQWVVEDGPFDYNFSWLTSKYSRSEMAEWASRYFEQSIGVHPDKFRIL
jgi:hypothetical protein